MHQYVNVFNSDPERSAKIQTSVAPCHASEHPLSSCTIIRDCHHIVGGKPFRTRALTPGGMLAAPMQHFYGEKSGRLSNGSILLQRVAISLPRPLRLTYRPTSNSSPFQICSAAANACGANYLTAPSLASALMRAQLAPSLLKSTTSARNLMKTTAVLSTPVPISCVSVESTTPPLCPRL